jgi:TetR/AcrR family transcriptional regulator, transcriptional repressor for nem operon
MEQGHIERAQPAADLLRRITAHRHQPREQRHIVVGRRPFQGQTPEPALRGERALVQCAAPVEHGRLDEPAQLRRGRPGLRVPAVSQFIVNGAHLCAGAVLRLPGIPIQDEPTEQRTQVVVQGLGESLDRVLGRGVEGMVDAGLTNGAFYAHFGSKEDLVATAVADQLRTQSAAFTASAPDLDGLERLLRAYLSVEHRDDLENGCPSTALLDEIGRCTDTTKQALSVFAMMVGTLQLSRALADRRLADDVLEQGIQNGLALLGVRPRA